MSIKLLVLAILLQTILHVTTLRIPQTDFYTREAVSILKRHNIYRQCHNAPALKLDEHLSEKAQQCAANSALNHSQPTNGTNVFSYHSSILIDSSEYRFTELLGVNAVDQWYREQLKYPEWFPTNFSQLVWKSSEKLGVGITQADDGEVFICCTYDPAGNIRGYYEDNVLYSTNLSDADIEKCLQSAGTNPAENAAVYKNMVRSPISYLLFVNETADGEEEATTSDSGSGGGAGSEAAGSGSEAAGSDNSATSIPQKADESNSTVNITGRNCTGPNCTRSNDSRPLMNALKRELQMAVVEQSKKTNDLIKIAIAILVIVMIFILIVLIVTIVILMKITKMINEEECCETGNDTPTDEPRFAKSLAPSVSVPPSMQSYM